MLAPAAAGRPTWRSTTSSSNGLSSDPPHPLTPGAVKVLSTREAPLILTIVSDGFRLTVPGLPVIGWVPEGGFVAPVVSCRRTGSVSEPT